MDFNIPNHYVLGLASWLNELLLPGRESVLRTEFVKQCSVAYLKLEEERNSIIKEYAETYNDIKEECKEEATRRIQEVLLKEVVINVPEHVYKAVKRMVLDTRYTFGCTQDTPDNQREARTRQMNDYAQWCKLFTA